MVFETVELLNKIQGEVVCKIGSETKAYVAGADAIKDFENHKILSVGVEDGKIALVMSEDKVIPDDMNADWVKEHVEKYGKEPSFF